MLKVVFNGDLPMSTKKTCDDFMPATKARRMIINKLVYLLTALLKKGQYKHQQHLYPFCK